MTPVSRHLNTRFSPLFSRRGKRRLGVARGEMNAFAWKRHIASIPVSSDRDYQGGRGVRWPLPPLPHRKSRRRGHRTGRRGCLPHRGLENYWWEIYEFFNYLQQVLLNLETYITDSEYRPFSEIILNDFSIKINDVIFVKTAGMFILMKRCFIKYSNGISIFKRNP